MSEALTPFKPGTDEERVARYYARERRLSFAGLQNLFLSLSQPIPTTIEENAQFAPFDRPSTLQTRIRVTGGSPLGLVFELGSSTIGAAIWVDALGIFASFGSGVAASNDAVVVSFQPVGGLPDTAEFDIVASILPGNGKARMWINGVLTLDGKNQAVNAGLTSGVWSDTGNGSFAAAPNGTVTQAVPVAARIAPSDFAVIETLSYFSGQLPQQFLQ